MIAHDVLAYSFRSGPGKKRGVAIEDIEDGIPIGGVLPVLRSSNRGRVGLYARERRHPPVSSAPTSSHALTQPSNAVTSNQRTCCSTTTSGSRLLISGQGRSLIRMVGGHARSPQTLDLTIKTVQTAKTFVGTAQYVAPELLENNETSRR